MFDLRSLALVTVAACGGGGGDDAPGGGGPVELRQVFTRSITTPATSHTFDGDPAIQPGDQVIAMLQAPATDDVELVTMPPGWELMADDLAVMCTGMFHVWFLKTVAAADTTFTFELSVADKLSAIVASYSGASDVTLLEHIKMGEHRNEAISFPATTLQPDSMVWIGGGGQTNWSTLDAPVETELISTVDFLAAYQRDVPDGQLAAIELPNDNSFCANVAQIAVEP